MEEIIEKYKLVKHRTKVYPMISKVTGIKPTTIMQQWFNVNKGIKVPEKYREDVLMVLNMQLDFQELEKKHYNTFNK